ncbi:alpha-amylase family glycosyl hydrolase [Shewanella sp. 10N.286.51.B7]|uniref:alpha-amylase family glycosyl hydrolase n=1 Tax=Shewanella sp. 10N.286.51.B7 TaxID=1880836 RepID=UPI0018E42FD4|nr:alpha-amylase family glycosyl hydrolase [Shewanella sp. 10N.286.51.B7]
MKSILSKTTLGVARLGLVTVNAGVLLLGCLISESSHAELPQTESSQTESSQTESAAFELASTQSISRESNVSEPPASLDIYQDYLHRDIRDDIFYFVLPDRFNNGNEANDNGALSGISHGGVDKTSARGFHGGDITGIEQKLDYLASLGITAIWMTPLLRNQAIQKDGIAHHGYWIVDFSEIDPHFGSNDDLKALINAAHQRGMKVFFDIITNHTADIIRYSECHQQDGQFRQGLDHCEYKPLSTSKTEQYSPFILDEHADIKVPEWLNDPQYYHNQGDSSFKGESSLNGDFNGLDDLNTKNPQVLKGMIEIYQQLIAEFKPDGFRIDTVRHVDLSFWQTFTPAIIDYANRQGIPNFHVFGEVYDTNPHHLSLYTTEGKLPSVLDFAFQDVAADIFYRGKSPLLAKQLFEQDVLYQDEDSQADLLMTFLSNHDMGRAGYFINGSGLELTATEKLQRSILSHAFMFLSRGIPVVYYGDEQGFTGDGNDIDAREDMFPSKVNSYNDNVLMGTSATTAEDNFNQSHPLFMAISALSQLRKEHRSLRRGVYQPRYYQASTIQASSIQASSIQASSIQASSIQASAIQASSIQASSIQDSIIQDSAIQANSGMFAFARVDETSGEEYLIVFNSGNQSASIEIDMTDKGEPITAIEDVLKTFKAAGDLYYNGLPSSNVDSSHLIDVEKQAITVSMPRLSYGVYQIKR